MLPSLANPEGRAFNISKNSLSIGILLTGISMFVAQFEEQLEKQQFEKLDVLMLLFFFLIGQGIIFSILVLYNSHYADKQHLQRALWPVLPLFVLYALIYAFTGDIRVYSFKEFFLLTPDEPLLMLRCIILVSMTSSIAYTLRLCHKAKAEYHQLILNYFSETDFSRSLWLANLLGYAEALSIWVFLTYFYTTPILEVIVGILITIFFTLYIKEFRYYSKRYPQLQPAILVAAQNHALTSQPQHTSLFLQPDPVTTVLHAKEYVKSDNTIAKTTTATAENFLNSITKKEDAQLIEETIMVTDDEAIYYKKCADLLAEWIKRDDKPYMKSGLTIGDVANDLDIPKYRLSSYINQKQINFNTWVKTLRIEEASRMLVNHPQLSASAIAKSCGFCDLPAFSRAFKKIKGVSPTEYRNNNSSDSDAI